MAGAALAGAAAVVLLTLLPLDGIITLPTRGVKNIKALFLQNSAPETITPLPQAGTPTVRAQLAPSEFPKVSRVVTDAKPLTPSNKAEPAIEIEKPTRPTEIVNTTAPAKADDAPAVEDQIRTAAAAPTMADDIQTVSSPAPRHSSILGQITVRQGETISKIIKNVYGRFNAKYFNTFILANPDLEDPDRVEVGQIISLPAIPVEVTKADRLGWWVKVDDTDLMEEAYNILRNYPDITPGMCLIPYWTPGDGMQFSVVLNKLFKDEQTARNQLALMPQELLLNSEVVSFMG